VRTMLFAMNFGPTTFKDVMAELNGTNSPKPARTEVTLLDRPLAAKLHKALYDWRGYSLGFETDWSPNREQKEPTSGVSPFDYASSVETFPLVWSEDFVVNSVWNDRSHYSSSIVGRANKPPLAAVVLDMVDLITFLKSISAKTPKKLVEWTTMFLQTTKLRSIIQYEKTDEDWAARGYIADLFSIVACINCTSDTSPPLLGGLDMHKNDKFPWAYRRNIPGAGVMLPNPPPVASASLEPNNPVAELNASFIHSGPFKLKTTRHLEKHLTFNDKNKIRLFQYWGSQWPEHGLPAHPSLRIYTHHALRGFVRSILC